MITQPPLRSGKRREHEARDWAPPIQPPLKSMSSTAKPKTHIGAVQMFVQLAPPIPPATTGRPRLRTFSWRTASRFFFLRCPCCCAWLCGHALSRSGLVRACGGPRRLCPGRHGRPLELDLQLDLPVTDLDLDLAAKVVGDPQAQRSRAELQFGVPAFPQCGCERRELVGRLTAGQRPLLLDLEVLHRCLRPYTAGVSGRTSRSAVLHHSDGLGAAHSAQITKPLTAIRTMAQTGA